MQNAMPSNMWPAPKAHATAVRRPAKLVQNIDSCILIRKGR